MRIHRIRLKDFRGVDACEIEPDPFGVTIVEGPNEVGKSSLAEALHLVLEEPASSRKQAIRQMQPADRDEGPEVEVEITTGAYRFTLLKRYLKRPKTELRITEPTTENRTGREAHDRVQAILNETMDGDLWQALSVVQGTGVGQPRLSDATALTSALDRAAGQRAIGERESSVFDAVHAAYGEYYTDTARERKPLLHAAEEVADAEEEARDLHESLGELDDLVARSDLLALDITRLSREKAEAEENAARKEAQRVDVEARAQEVDRLRDAHLAAAAVKETADAKSEERRSLIAAVATGAERVSNLQSRLDQAAPELAIAADREKRLAEALAEAQRLEAQSRALVEQRSRDRDYFQAASDLNNLTDRKRRIDAAREAIAKAKDSLSRIQVDDERLRKLQDKERERDLAIARLEAGSPRVTLTAHTETDFEVDGEEHSLGAGQTADMSVAEEATIRVPDVLTMHVHPGTSLDQLLSRRDRLEEDLCELLAAVGVASTAQAERELKAREEAERAMANARRDITQSVRDLTEEEVRSRVEELAAKLDGYVDGRREEPALPADLEEAREVFAQAQAAHEEASAGLAKAGEAHESALDELRRTKDVTKEIEVELNFARRELKTTEERLEAARGEGDDEKLARELREAAQAEAEARGSWQGAARRLDAEDPERIRELAQNAQLVAERSARSLREKEDERQRVIANLELLGQMGLYDAYEKACTKLEHAERRERSVKAQAAAARLLFETMSRKRDEARRAYVAPLRETIRQLGRYVFNESFDVAIDDESLSISARTMDGVTLPFDSLSVGAKEQLGLIARLACAMLVDEEEGVPLIFDDTLGHTDPVRLEGMGALLNRSGGHCQIVVLTCTPGRFRHIGEARTVTFPSGSARPSE